MKKTLEVLKSDGSLEEYVHTKVLGTFYHAFDCINESDVFLAQELADVVTYYIYHNHSKKRIYSHEILSVIKVVLATTGHEAAAAALSQFHYERRLQRNRIEVASMDIQDLDDAQQLCETHNIPTRYRWDKSHIVNDLIDNYGVSRQTARTIASLVEEKVLKMGIRMMPASLIKQLVLGDTAAVLQAQQQLQTG
jgi:hypothetical protein